MLGVARIFRILGSGPAKPWQKFYMSDTIDISLSLCPRWVKTRRGAVLYARLNTLVFGAITVLAQYSIGGKNTNRRPI